MISQPMIGTKASTMLTTHTQIHAPVRKIDCQAWNFTLGFVL